MLEHEIEILYKDEYLIAVNKPYGLPVHKNEFMAHDAAYLNKMIGTQIGQGVYNVHRIDAKTSGLVLLALSSQMANLLTLQFERKEIEKTYFALVLGVTDAEGTYDGKVLVKKKFNSRKEAVTKFKTIRTIETGIEHKEESNTKISLVEMKPLTGRWHQLRQHFAQNRHDIIGDTHHGDFAFNHKFTDLTGIKRLMLHAGKVEFNHPVSQECISIETDMPDEFELAFKFFSSKE